MQNPAFIIQYCLSVFVAISSSYYTKFTIINLDNFTPKIYKNTLKFV